MKVLVTGASGFVGREIMGQLHAAGHSIRLLARNLESPGVRMETARYGAEVCLGNVLDLDSLTGSLTGIDAVVHLIGIISECGRNTFESVHTMGTRNIVTAAQMAGVGRYVQMSALGTRPNAVARYHRSKWDAEEIVRHSGLAWTIFRPSIIYGSEDQFVNLFARIARFSPFIPVMGNGLSKMQPIPVGDVAACFVGALNEPRAIGQTYDLCGPEALSFVDMLDAIMEAMGRKRLKIHVPMALARIQASVLEFIFPRLLGKPSPLNRDQLLMLRVDNVGNPQAANELFKLHPIPFKEGISRYLSPA